MSVEAQCKLGIAVVVVAVIAASFQAKLSLYRAETPHVHFIAKSFKPSECRLQRAVSNTLPADLLIAVGVTPHQQCHEPLESTPARFSSPPYRRFHWSRPPPPRA